MNISISLSLLVLAAFLATPVQAALSSTVTYDYGTVSTHLPTSPGSGASSPDSVSIVKQDQTGFSDTFLFDGFATITRATISVTHNGNFDTILPTGYGENWQILLNGSPVAGGSLSNSFYDWTTGTLISGWKTDIFTLDSAALASLNSGRTPLTALISFTDPTLGQNIFSLHSISFSVTGDPTPVPLPATLVLFAPGLLMVRLICRRQEMV